MVVTGPFTLDIYNGRTSLNAIAIETTGLTDDCLQRDDGTLDCKLEILRGCAALTYITLRTRKLSDCQWGADSIFVSSGGWILF